MHPFECVLQASIQAETGDSDQLERLAEQRDAKRALGFLPGGGGAQRAGSPN